MLLGLTTWLQSRVSEMQNERGATAIEYGLLAALIAAVIITVVITLGENLTTIFQFIADELADALP